MASVVFLNGDFHFPEHTACNAVDGVAQGINSQACIEIKDIQEILVLKVEIRAVGTAGKHSVGDADGDRPSEGYFDVVYIITFQVAVCNDVEDGLPVVLPVFESQLIGDLLQLVFQRTLGLDAKGSFQCVLDRLSVFDFYPPQLVQREGASTGAGIGNIENVSQVGLVPSRDEQRNALGTPLHIPLLIVTPCVVFLAGHRIGTLGMDHNLLRVGEVIVSPHGGQEGRPILSVGGHLTNGVCCHC